jgi:hypothetical protein
MQIEMKNGAKPTGKDIQGRNKPSSESVKKSKDERSDSHSQKDKAKSKVTKV